MNEPKRLRDDDSASPELRELVRGARRSRPMSDLERARHRRTVARIAAGPVAATVWLWSSKLWATLISVATLGLGVAIVALPALRRSRERTTVASAPSAARANAPRAPRAPERSAHVTDSARDPSVSPERTPTAAPPVQTVTPPAAAAASVPVATRDPGLAHSLAPRVEPPRAHPVVVAAVAPSSRNVAVTPAPRGDVLAQHVAPPPATTPIAAPSDSVTQSATTPAAPPAATGTLGTSSPTASGSNLAGVGGSAAAPPPDALAQETQAMIRAHGLLATQPAAALALVEEVLRSHPHTHLAPEGSYIAIHALRRLGRTEEARQRAQRLVASAPRSPQANAVRRLFPDLE